MGVKYKREYRDIINDLVPAIASIPDCHLFFGMTTDEWNSLAAREQMECLRTLADDLFYGLGSVPKIEVGAGMLEYDARNHLIKVKPDSSVVRLIHLI